MLDCVKKAQGGCYICVHAVPGSKKAGFSYDEFTKTLRVKICAPALDGKANKELLSVFKDFFPGIVLHSGSKSREKLLFVSGAETDAVRGVLEKLVRD